jgi:hypothetical protein
MRTTLRPPRRGPQEPNGSHAAGSSGSERATPATGATNIQQTLRIASPSDAGVHCRAGCARDSIETMSLLGRIGSWRKARKYKKTGKAIHDALDKAYESAPSFPLAPDTPVVIFSDHHKGARDGADDFQRCERTYNAALAYYDELGYHLMELGDVEELWENSFKEVVASYPVTLQLAARFREHGRYTRFYGNHDLLWKDSDLFTERMSDYGYAGAAPIEAVRIVVSDGDNGQGGEIFVVHGHQGTADSDRHAKFSEFFVRHGWRVLQRVLDRPWSTPSVDWALRGEHAEHMADWAGSRRRIVIAGHTHLPVFFNSAKQPAAAPVDVPADPDAHRAKALQLARSQWAQADEERLRHQKPFPLKTPCYFNTGCCSFGDGDITGIELSNGEIHLIQWPCIANTEPRTLAHMPLSDVFRLAA